jgi:hypothetical protein
MHEWTRQSDGWTLPVLGGAAWLGVFNTRDGEGKLQHPPAWGVFLCVTLDEPGRKMVVKGVFSDPSFAMSVAVGWFASTVAKESFSCASAGGL